MPIAVFECSDAGIANCLYKSVDVCPARVYDIKCIDTLACIVFRGNCAAMYWWCFELAAPVNSLAFLGIDEQANFPRDLFNIAVLKDMHVSHSLRSSLQIHYWNDLMHEFLVSLSRCDYTYQQIVSVCEMCVLGEDRNASAINCAEAIELIRRTAPRQDYGLVLDGVSNEKFRSRAPAGYPWVPSNNTLMRVMVHFCYLNRSADRRRGLFFFRRM